MQYTLGVHTGCTRGAVYARGCIQGVPLGVPVVQYTLGVHTGCTRGAVYVGGAYRVHYQYTLGCVKGVIVRGRWGVLCK